MNPYPTDLQLVEPQQLQITWSDGVKQLLTARQLRAQCPCASCLDQRPGAAAAPDLLPVLLPEETQPLSFVSLRPLGNYAYAIGFSDGHDTGIYTLELLRELGEALQ